MIANARTEDRRHAIETDNPIVRNNVTITGRLDAPRTIVFAHGFGSDQSAWSRVAAAFADDYRIVLYDHVGAGKSDPAAFVQHKYLRLETYARDLLAICAALELEGAALVGHSMGAMIGLLAAIERPHHFSRQILVGASPRYLDDGDYRGGFTKGDLNTVYSAMQANFLQWADGFAPLMIGEGHSPNFARAFAESLKSISPKKALTVACAVFQSDHRADLKKVSIPTLIIQSLHDFAVPMSVANYLHAHIPGSTLRVIEASGHLPHVTADAEVAAAIRAFI